MRSLLTRTVLAVGAVVAAVILAATSASAATWVVANSPGTINGLAVGPTLIMHDPGGDQAIECESSTITIVWSNGGSDGHPIGQITDLQFNNCKIDNLIALNVVCSGFSWDINAGSQTGDVVSGTITGNIQCVIQGTGVGANCSITMSGTILPFQYDNSTFQFIINGGGNLTVTAVPNVAGCFNTVHAGDTAGLLAIFDTDAQVTINMQ